MANKKRRCSHCRKYFDAESGIIRGAQFFCCKEHLIEYAVSNKDSLVRKGQKIERKIQREKKESIRPIKWYADRAQAEFNRFIRLRDKGKPCVSCGKPDDGSHQRHASHYRSRGACSYLRFDESNCHTSCSKCNNYLSGNIEGYTPELINRIGKDEYDRIVNSPKTKKWSKEELIEIYEAYKSKCKELENENE